MIALINYSDLLQAIIYIICAVTTLITKDLSYTFEYIFTTTVTVTQKHGDKAYIKKPILSALEEMGSKPYIPLSEVVFIHITKIQMNGYAVRVIEP